MVQCAELQASYCHSNTISLIVLGALVTNERFSRYIVLRPDLEFVLRLPFERPSYADGSCL